MFVACSESVANVGLLAVFPAAYVLQTLARPPGEFDAASRATLEYGVLASGVRHIVVCGHSGCWGDGDAHTPEASQALVVARCRAMKADEQIGPVLHQARVTMQALWFDEASHDLYACDFEGRPALCLADADLATMFNRFDEFSA